jgi:hypothetical protein
MKELDEAEQQAKEAINNLFETGEGMNVTDVLDAFERVIDHARVLLEDLS